MTQVERAKRKREARILRKAAKMLEDGLEGYPCVAVGKIDTGNKYSWLDIGSLGYRFIKQMAPVKKGQITSEIASSDYLWNDGLRAGVPELALCFAAAMAETGDLP